ncbi:MAG: NAD(P)-dependent glycerol-3-phosphate dehydrogenase [Candidatus Latescibacteria bacterium]|jgi:glycerol-3-phosphate dehydrogenase (NAD(P)+)|nr:NAD(P)-dependent glycerol-3-phosphate dehydrogenase [Candidatus Latescibacterota bacterium]
MIITVMGAGNWGTTLALLLYEKGHQIRLWEYKEQLARDMIAHRENRTYLKGFTLPEAITVTSSLGEAVDGAEIILFVIPSSAMRQTARLLRDCGALFENAILVSFSKGLEHDTLITMTDVIASEIKGRRMVALSGPCIASEVSRKLPTTIVSASLDSEAAFIIQDVFMTPRFRVYTSDDISGIQLGGALKNIIAIAAGMNDGLGFGSNAKSALITRGIVEIKRFGISLGSKPETFNGLSGIGDLITTCFSGHSRNRHLGEEIGKGRLLEDILDEMVMVAEGVPTTKAVYEYSCRHNIDMPITEKVYKVLFGDISAKDAVSELMSRDRKSEHHFEK